MSDRFTQAHGRKVVSRTSAEELGRVSHLMVDPARRRVAALVVGKRRKARLVDWDSVVGFGADAIIVPDEASLREPNDEREEAASDGELELLGRRALTDRGDELGKIDDVIFDPRSGMLEAFVVGEREEPAGGMLGAGSYAVVLRATGAAAPGDRGSVDR